MVPRLSVRDSSYDAARTIWRHRKVLFILWLVWTALRTGYYHYGGPNLAGGTFRLIGEITGPAGFSAEVLRTLNTLVLRIPSDMLESVLIVLLFVIFLEGSLSQTVRSTGALAKAVMAVFLFHYSFAVVAEVPIDKFDDFVDRSVSGRSRLFLTYVYFGALLIQIWLISRICLVYPSAALGRGLQLRNSWRHTSGSQLALTGMLILVGLPVAYAASAIDDWSDLLEAAAADPGLVAMADSAAMSGLIVLRMIVLVALGAVVFSRLTEFHAVGIPGRSKDLAKVFD